MLPSEFISVAVDAKFNPPTEQGAEISEDQSAVIYLNKAYEHFAEHMTPTKTDPYQTYSQPSRVPVSVATIRSMIRSDGPFYPFGCNYGAQVTFDGDGVSIKNEGSMARSFQSSQYHWVASSRPPPELSEHTAGSPAPPLTEDIAVLLRDRDEKSDQPWLLISVEKGQQGRFRWQYGQLKLLDGTGEDGKLIPKSTGRSVPTLAQIRG